MVKKELRIMYSDLKEEAQKKVLKFLKIKTLEELNLDMIPLNIFTQDDIPEDSNFFLL